MEIRLDGNEWVINDKYFITEGVNGYEVYSCGTDESVADELFSSGNFEECLIWIWNSL